MKWPTSLSIPGHNCFSLVGNAKTHDVLLSVTFLFKPLNCLVSRLRHILNDFEWVVFEPSLLRHELFVLQYRLIDQLAVHLENTEFGGRCGLIYRCYEVMSFLHIYGYINRHLANWTSTDRMECLWMAILLHPMLFSTPQSVFPPLSWAVPASSSAAHTWFSLRLPVSHRQNHAMVYCCRPWSYRFLCLPSGLSTRYVIMPWRGAGQ